MTRCVASLLLLLSLCGEAAAGPDPYLGETVIFPYTFCPRGYVPMNGAILPIQQNIALFSLLGARFGGDGQRTFAVPKANALYTVTRATLMQCIATQGVFPSRP